MTHSSEKHRKAVAVSEERKSGASLRGLIVRQPFSLPESAQTLAGIAFRTARKLGRSFQQRRNLLEKLSSKECWTAAASLLEFSELKTRQRRDQMLQSDREQEDEQWQHRNKNRGDHEKCG